MNIDFIHDKLLVKLFILKKNNRIRYCFHNVMETDKYSCIKNYILNRYRDSLSPQETLRRIEYDIEIRPKCVVCGNDVRYVGKPDSNGLFKQFCSKSCANKYNYEKAKKTKIEKYGSSNNEQKRKQTCLEKYGDENYNNHEQTVRTNIERYGGVAPACNEEIHNKIIKTFKKIYSERGDEIDAKKKQTTFERYGNENYRNVDKIKETWANKTDKERADEATAGDDDTDPFLMDAIDVVVETGQASTSFIQRRFKVGYARAGRIIDQMEERGIISGYQGSKPRQVLMSLEKLQELKMGTSSTEE